MPRCGGRAREEEGSGGERGGSGRGGGGEGGAAVSLLSAQPQALSLFPARLVASLTKHLDSGPAS